MLTKRHLDLIWQIDTACRKCIRAVLYFKAVTDKEPELWTFLQHCFGEVAVIQWCHVFNKYQDCTHFTQLFADPAISQIDPELRLDRVRSRLRRVLGMSQEQYAAFRKQMVDFRNSYAAHWDFEKKVMVFPDVDLAMSSCIEMRSILRQLVLKGVGDQNSQELKDLKYLLTAYDNDHILKFFHLEADHLKKIK
jgi:hypothetical protein